MKREVRLVKPADFRRVRRRGKSYAHPFVVLIVLASQSDNSRVGVSAGRRVGRAVQRNRAKRVLRAAMQPLIEHIRPPQDILLLARPDILEAKSTQVQEALAGLLRKANLLQT